MGWGSFSYFRIALVLLNLIYLMVGSVLIAVAAYGKFAAIIETVTVMSGLVVCGVVLLLVSIIGLIGAIRHHQVLLFFYMVLLFLLFLVQFALACACLALSSEQQRHVLRLGWARASNALKDQMQRHFSCCGFDNLTVNLSPDDPDHMGHPRCDMTLCCEGHDSEYNTVNSTNSTLMKPHQLCSCPPCLSRAEIHLNAAVKTVGTLGLIFSLTELFGVGLAIKYRNLKDPHANPNSFL